MKVTLSDVLRKDLRIVAFLVGSWLSGLGIYYLDTGSLPPRLGLLGLIPAINYVAYRIKEELAKEGYREALK